MTETIVKIKDYFTIQPLLNKNFSFSNSIGYSDKTIISSKIKTEVKNFILFIDWLFKNTSKTIAFFSFDDIFKRFWLNSSEIINLKNTRKH